MISKSFGALAALALFISSPALAEVMTNQSVVSLLKAGLGDDLVIAKINTEPCNYAVSTTDILSLNQQLRNANLPEINLNQKPKAEAATESIE